MRECGWSSSDSDPGRFSLRLQKSAGRGRIGVPRAGIARPRTFQCRSLCPARSPLIPPSRIEWRFLSCLDGRGVGWSVSSATELGSIWMVSKGVVPSYGDRRFESPSLQQRVTSPRRWSRSPTSRVSAEPTRQRGNCSSRVSRPRTTATMLSRAKPVMIAVALVKPPSWTTSRPVLFTSSA